VESSSRAPLGTPGVVVVTGGAGFIGSHLVEALLGEGCCVRVLDNFDAYYEGKEQNLRSAAGHPRFTLERGDILDEGALGRVFRGAEVVFHLAAQPGVRFSFEQEEKTRRVNIDGTRSVLEAAARAGVRRLVFASSSSVYGHLEKLPVSENEAVRPISPYGESKARGEDLVRQFQAAGDLETVMVRVFSAYGPRQRPDMAGTRFLERLTASASPVVTGDGMQTRDFTYVRDAVAGFLAASRTTGGVGDVFNLGTGREVTLRRFLSLLVEGLGRDASAVEYAAGGQGEPGRMRCDASKAERVLGWRAATPLEQGVRDQVDWWVTERMPILRSRRS
jgi:nucleoside-diphosphate-sugar epimerase